MSTIKNADIVGYVVDGADVCLECVKKEEAEAADLDSIITTQDIGKTDDRTFCDRCKKEL